MRITHFIAVMTVALAPSMAIAQSVQQAPPTDRVTAQLPVDAFGSQGESRIVCRPPQLVELAKRMGRNLCVQNSILANLKATGPALEAAARAFAEHRPGNTLSGSPDAISCRQMNQAFTVSDLTCAQNSYWTSPRPPLPGSFSVPPFYQSGAVAPQ